MDSVLPLYPFLFAPFFAPFTFVCLWSYGVVGINPCTYCSRRGLVGISGDYDVITIAQYLKIARISSFFQIWYIFRVIFEVGHF